MNPGIFYLYEYENNTRRRNVGFIKISRRYQTCILQIHVRGISAGNGAPLELYAFYRDGTALTGTQIATLTCFGKTVSARLPVSERSFPEGRPLSEIDGFLLKLPGEKNPLFWMASAFFFPVDISMLRPPASVETEEPAGPIPGNNGPEESGSVAEDTIPEGTAPVPEEGDNQRPVSTPEGEDDQEPAPAPEEENDQEPVPAPEDSQPQSPLPENDTSQTPVTAPENTDFPKPDAGPDNLIPEPAVPMTPEGTPEKTESAEPEAPYTNPDEGETPSGLPEGISGQEKESVASGGCPAEGKKKARKIQRSDIAVLPRRFWFLANNSFLLHGYHNYNHLLLAEESGRLWLGVPGIYDSREARAADLFGFPQFTREYNGHLDLEPEERSDSADFGYWCRCVGAGRIE